MNKKYQSLRKIKFFDKSNDSFYFDIKFKKDSLSGKNSLITIEKADKLPENPDNFKNFQKSLIFTCFLFGIGIY